MRCRIIVSVLVLFFLLSAANLGAEEILLGAGATFPSPLYEKWMDEYAGKTGVRLSYQKIGSGGGIESLVQRKVDFGGTDVVVTDEEMRRNKVSITHIPSCLGGVAIIYNLPGKIELRLTPGVMADIFQGRITNWSDRKITAINPDVTLPDLSICVVHRSESSGTTNIFTEYLDKVSSSWKRRIGTGKKVKWPVGMGVEKNSGVAGMVKKVPGSIGYVQLNYAQENGLPAALVRNRCGNYIKPTIESVSRAAAMEMSSDMRMSITDSTAPEGYPISSFTYLIVHTEQAYYDRSEEKADALVAFLWWCIHDGQKYTGELYYSPLPDATVRMAEQVIRSITYKGKPVFR